MKHEILNYKITKFKMTPKINIQSYKYDEKNRK